MFLDNFYLIMSQYHFTIFFCPCQRFFIKNPDGFRALLLEIFLEGKSIAHYTSQKAKYGGLFLSEKDLVKIVIFLAL